MKHLWKVFSEMLQAKPTIVSEQCHGHSLLRSLLLDSVI